MSHPRWVAASDIPLFVLASALAASGLRWPRHVAVTWTVLVAMLARTRVLARTRRCDARVEILVGKKRHVHPRARRHEVRLLDECCVSFPVISSEKLLRSSSGPETAIGSVGITGLSPLRSGTAA